MYRTAETHLLQQETDITKPMHACEDVYTIKQQTLLVYGSLAMYRTAQPHLLQQATDITKPMHACKDVHTMKQQTLLVQWYICNPMMSTNTIIMPEMFVH